MQLCENSRVPKVVDHEERRSELAAAVSRIVARDGLPAATVRAVAAESGWSAGAVRYYFSTQDELLRFAAEAMVRRVPERMRAVMAAGRPGRRRALALLEELLPLDDERTAECVVWVAWLVRHRGDTAYDALRLTAWHGERLVCRFALADGLGLTPPAGPRARLPRRWEPAVDVLHAVVDGLTLLGTTHPDRLDAAGLRRRLAAGFDAAVAGRG
jgi:AcrR family transcriptional regulator